MGALNSKLGLFILLLMGFTAPALASEEKIDLTTSTVGIICVAIFVVAYALVMLEEKLHLRKSKPVLVAAGIIWALISLYYVTHDISHVTEHAFRHNLLEYAELMLFLLVAMTYINALEERKVFDRLRAWMIQRGFSYQSLFWITGFLAFFISPIADNLTTALLMCAVVMKVAEGDKRFINISCINVVIAANAGGAFSPFGDITTLMVWQAGLVQFNEFLSLFFPSLVNYMVPAAIMSLFIEKKNPSAVFAPVTMQRGARRILILFLLTVLTAVLCHSLLHMPPVMGMMMGLGYLQFFGYYLRVTLKRRQTKAQREGDRRRIDMLGSMVPFDIFNKVARAEWDTLLFFYGIVMCVGGLGFLGYLSLLSEVLYGQWSATSANVFLGILSSVIDNIPVMFAVLSMQPEMSHGQWLLITLTAGVGGSLLSIGSAAGVALMGQARGYYTFFGHLKWAPVIALGYIASVLTHLWLNAELF
ncbi:sodium:proton antiporter [Pseudoalteromonas sp. JBTF-M23]|uniref:Sodium:proton antiporter n=1 Tax=Pseudoalteromonas caenipelagi TaxID=2726988 RepID=A0A849VIY1_9GAMM|nr:sodium:proton antiporter NhaD [Pseudoalteromonas caenipelagi]NOU52423.1 sodium:proton antiporter [Pseudoalteromonas caenipelagi]